MSQCRPLTTSNILNQALAQSTSKNHPGARFYQSGTFNAVEAFYDANGTQRATQPVTLASIANDGHSGAQICLPIGGRYRVCQVVGGQGPVGALFEDGLTV